MILKYEYAIFRQALSIERYIKEILKEAVNGYKKLAILVMNGDYELDKFSELIKDMKEFKQTLFVDSIWKAEFRRLLGYVKCYEPTIALRIQQLDVFINLNTIIDIVNDLREIVRLEFGSKTEGFEDLYDIDDWVRF